MNKTQNAQDKMSKATVELLLANKKITAALPAAFQTHLDAVQSILAEIHKLEALQEEGITGITANKKIVRNILIESAMNIIAKMIAYAMVIKDVRLRDKIKYTKSDLSKMTDERLISACNNVYTNAELHITALKEYAVTEEMVSTLQKNTEAFDAAIKEAVAASSQKDANTKTIGDLFDKMMVHWREIDIIIKILMDTQKEFYGLYITTRRVMVPGGRSMEMKVRTFGMQSAQPVPFADLELVPVMDPSSDAGSDTRKRVLKTTTELGQAFFKNVEPGEYYLTAKKYGFKETTMTVYIVKEEMQTVDVMMEEIEASKKSSE